MSFQYRLKPVQIRDIRVTDSFWTGWQTAVRDNSLSAQYDQLEGTGRLENFRRAARKESGSFEGIYFNDSDVYKWAEAAAYALATGSNGKLKDQLETVIGVIEKAQESDGYINTFFQVNHPSLKWTNICMMHEMYCGGHLIEAGVALSESLNDDRLLTVAKKFADHAASIFGPGKRKGYCGHEEIELALIRLAELTGDAQYSKLARWMVEERGSRPSPFEPEMTDPVALSLSPWGPGHMMKGGKYSGEYEQDHAPIREHDKIVGHAVRAMYLYMAATDLADDTELAEALERIWANLVGSRMYITGGIGPSSHNEGFTNDFDLPNLTAYAETCASIGLVFWGHRLVNRTGNGEYADVMERALYNGSISGISQDGKLFFYCNPLESRGNDKRVPWYGCACCPPNIARMIASVGRYLAGVSESAFWIHVPAGFEAKAVMNGVPVTLKVESNYPWSGNLAIKVETSKPVTFELRIRIPDWCNDCSFEIEGDAAPAEYDHGYAVFNREWSQGDSLVVDFEMTPSFQESDPRVLDNLGRVAITKGPLVYTLEEADFGSTPQSFVVDPYLGIQEDGKNLIVSGTSQIDVADDSLYCEYPSVTSAEVSAKLVPYYTWCNRGSNHMQVWLRRNVG